VTDIIKILIVDDEPGIRSLLADYLVKQGFEIFTADGAGAARRYLAEQPIDLIVLDLKMPGEDGLSLARYIREHHTAAIIMLTAIDGPTDRIVGLEIGADDYLGKPFDLRELLARIKSLLRRLQEKQQSGQADVPLQTGQLRVGRHIFEAQQRRLLTQEGEEITLTAAELDLLQIFLAHPNQVLERERLFELAYHRDWDPFDRSIDVRITRLRRKIEANPAKPRVIKTIHRKGYMLVSAD
jgi:two-component system phosphate regulon response regulator OmpR